MRFKVLTGKHMVFVPDGGRDAEGNPSGRTVVYKEGEVFESADDVQAAFEPWAKAGTFPPKFQRVDDAAAEPAPLREPALFRDRSLQELRELAEAEEVDLAGAETREQVVARLLA